MNDTAQNWFSIMEIEKEIGIPNATIRRYIRIHGHHLQIKKRGKAYFVASESLAIIKKIREIYEKGKQSEDVEEVLAKMNVPTTITMTDGEKEVTVTANEVLIQLQKDMNEQKKFNELLLGTIKQQQEYIDKKLEERDRKLIEALKESQQARKEIASAQQKKWWKFWE